MSAAHAADAADVLLFADLRGIATHGVVRVPAYLKRIEAGLINVAPRIETRAPAAFSRTIDSDNAMGAVGARAAVRACMEAVDRVGIGAVTVRRSNHFGAASAYTVPLASKGCIAIALSPAGPSLAPHGSREPLLGTNPFAIAAPAGRFAPWSLDIAASVGSRGRVRLAAQNGQTIPEGWALDREGGQTTDPNAALLGTMLPFGGAKGSGLSMMVDILGGVLSGSGFAGSIRDWNADFEAPSDVGHFFLAMKIEAFMPLAEFEGRMETAIERIKALPPAKGFDEVNYPGERSGRQERDNRANGIALAGSTVQGLRELADRLALPFPTPIG